MALTDQRGERLELVRVGRPGAEVLDPAVGRQGHHHPVVEVRLEADLVEDPGELQNPNVTKVDVDANQKTTMRFNVRAIPALLFFKDGKHVDTVVGLTQRPAPESKIAKHLAA